MNTQLGFGLAAIGRPQYINVGRKEKTSLDVAQFRKEGIQMIRAAYQQGIRYFDTAPGYGIAEALLLAWIQEDQPQDITVATKWGYTYSANLDLNATVHEVKSHELDKLEEQWAESRALLPWLQVYQIHSATLETGVLESALVLERLGELKDKHALAIGITTTGANQDEVLRKAMDIQWGDGPLFTAFQVTYNLFEQRTDEVLRELLDQGRQVIIKEALANGRVFPNVQYPHYQEAYAYLAALSKRYGVGVDAIALRFCMQSLNPHVVLSGAGEAGQLSQNVRALEVELTEDEMQQLKAFRVPSEAYWAERKQLTWK